MRKPILMLSFELLVTNHVITQGNCEERWDELDIRSYKKPSEKPADFEFLNEAHGRLRNIKFWIFFCK